MFNYRNFSLVTLVLNVTKEKQVSSRDLMRSAPSKKRSVRDEGRGVSGTGGGRSTQHNSSSSAEGAADVRDPAHRPVVISRSYF